MTHDQVAPTASETPRSRTMQLLLSLLFLVLFLSYARMHIAALSEFWPLNLRESANILNTEALLNAQAPPMYSWDSLPDQTNLYGPLYPLAASALAATFESAPYFAHRLTSGLFLLLSCAIIGVLISQQSGRHYGLIGAVLFYVATVASPSIAAGPDTMATFLYIAAIVTVHRFGFTRKTICLAATLSFAGLLTKPYTVLVIPGMLTYGYLYISPKRALLAASAIAATTLLGYSILTATMPAYFHSVFGIHSYYATRVLDTLLRQIWEFSYLQFAAIGLFALSFPYSSLLKPNTFALSSFYGDQPLFTSPMGFDRFMTLTAASVLLTVMGWHGGAYLIYFNHLLLPPLLIAALSRPRILTKHRGLSHSLLTTNALLLLFLLPSMPKGETYPELLNPLANENTPVLIDPILEPLRRILPSTDLVDNSQAEYLINYDFQHESPSQARTTAWAAKESAKVEAGAYKYLLLSNLYDRPHLFFRGKPRPPLTSRYEVLGFFEINIYHAAFRERDLIGEQSLPIFIFRRKDEPSQ